MGVASPSGGADSVADVPVSSDEVGADAAAAGNSKWPSRIGLIAGALVAIGAVVTTVIVVNSPRPDATLTQTGEDAPLDALLLINDEYAFALIDGASLRAHESFEGWDIYSGSNGFGAPCLVAVAPTDDWLRIECTPEPAQQVADTFPYSQPDGPMIRFILSGDTVEAWVYPHAKAQ